MRILVRDVVPRDQIVVMHASLGDVEWPGALEHARDGALRDGLPFVIARAKKSFFEMVEQRFKTRPSVPSWPSASTRQCTSDLKRGPIQREIRRILKERGLKKVVNCLGLRAQESHGRRKQLPVRKNEGCSIAGREWWDWLPIHALSLEQVLSTVRDAGEQLHPAYASGNERLSCMFCIMGSKNDLRNAALQNPTLYQRYIDLEDRTGYTMHQSMIPLRVIVGYNKEKAA